MLGSMPSELTAGEVAARLGVKSGMVRRYALALETVTGISLQVDPVRGRLYPVPMVELLETARAYLLAHPGESVEGALRAVTGQSEGEVTPPARVPGSLNGEELRAALGVMLAEVQAPVLEALRLQTEQNEKLSRELTETRAELQALQAQVRELPAPPSLTPVLDELQAQAKRADALGHELTETRAELHGATAPVFDTLTAQALTVEALRAQVERLTSDLGAARSTVERLEVMTRAALPGEPAAPQPEPVRSGVLGLLARLLGR